MREIRPDKHPGPRPGHRERVTGVVLEKHLIAWGKTDARTRAIYRRSSFASCSCSARARQVALWLAAWLAASGLFVAPARGQAIPGEPFGVASVPVPVRGEDAGLVHKTGGFQLVERHGRAFYPVFLNANLLERLGENLLDATDSVPNQMDVLFLFRGAEPLELTIHATESREVKLVPRLEPRRFQSFVSALVAGIQRGRTAANDLGRPSALGVYVLDQHAVAAADSPHTRAQPNRRTGVGRMATESGTARGRRETAQRGRPGDHDRPLGRRGDRRSADAAGPELGGSRCR